MFVLCFEGLLVLGVVLATILGLIRKPDIVLHPHPGGVVDLFVWALVVASVELLPVPVSSGLRLSLSFPILLGVAILYDSPFVVAAVILTGLFDIREIKREIPFITALFNRCQTALAFIAGNLVFHSIASVKAPIYLLAPSVLLATVSTYVVNVTLVLSYMRLVYTRSLSSLVQQLRVGALSEFLLSYMGLGFVGVIIARLYDAVHLWSVAAFILPLVFARQMFFRSMALEEASKELKDRERVLRALSNRMAEERQDERMQIAGYLHDDLAQQLFRLTLQAEMAKKRLAQGDVDGVTKHLDGIVTTKQETSDMVRALIRDLHRSPIGRKGLAEAIRSFAEDMSRGGPTAISTDVVEVSLPPPIQLLIYQIAREATMNALKHAEAENIRITLHETGDGVELQIWDDGKGFDTSAPPPEGHFGSVMMRERAMVAGGKFTVTSDIGTGTAISAAFPRVWVEEGTRLDSEKDASEGTPDGQASGRRQPPRGATTGPAPAEVAHGLASRRRSKKGRGFRSSPESRHDESVDAEPDDRPAPDDRRLPVDRTIDQTTGQVPPGQQAPGPAAPPPGQHSEGPRPNQEDPEPRHPDHRPVRT